MGCVRGHVGPEPRSVVLTMHYFSQTNGHDPSHPPCYPPHADSVSKKITRRTAAVVVAVVVAGLRGRVRC